MPLLGAQSPASTHISDDRIGSSLVYQSIAASAEFFRTSRFNRFSHMAGYEPGLAPVGKGSPTPAGFRRLRLCSLAWRCLPFLWRVTPGARTLQVRMIGTVSTGNIELGLTAGTAFGADRDASVITATPGFSLRTLTVPIDGHSGKIVSIYLWYRSAIDTAAVIQSGYTYIGRGAGSGTMATRMYFWSGRLPYEYGGLFYIRNHDNLNNPPEIDQNNLAWPGYATDTPTPNQALCLFDGTAYTNQLTPYAQIVRTYQGNATHVAGSGDAGTAVVVPDLDPYGVTALANPPAIRGPVGWRTYALAVYDINQIDLQES